MKKILLALVAVPVLVAATGCAYGGLGGVGTDKVVITRNDAFLFGALRQVFVCKVADSGVSSCQSAESP
jgi:hypothetical protein